jgi:hypothetical protein
MDRDSQPKLRPARELMRFGARLVLLPVITVTVLALFGAAIPKPAAPVKANLVSVTEVEDVRRVAVEFSWLTAARFHEANQLQIRAAGKWQPQLDLPKFADGCLFSRADCRRLVFDFPRQTEACRFSLGYRVGPRPNCRAAFFLARHGITRKFPALAKAILSCVPQQPRLEHVECEVEIPAVSPAGSTELAAHRFTIAGSP